jgi:hypothetical protein
MIFANVPRHERAAFVDRSAKNGIAANSNARTTRRFPAQIFSSDLLFHTLEFRISPVIRSQYGDKT